MFGHSKTKKQIKKLNLTLVKHKLSKLLKKGSTVKPRKKPITFNSNRKFKIDQPLEEWEINDGSQEDEERVMAELFMAADSLEPQGWLPDLPDEPLLNRAVTKVKEAADGILDFLQDDEEPVIMKDFQRFREISLEAKKKANKPPPVLSSERLAGGILKDKVNVNYESDFGALVEADQVTVRQAWENAEAKAEKRESDKHWRRIHRKRKIQLLGYSHKLELDQMTTELDDYQTPVPRLPKVKFSSRVLKIGAENLAPLKTFRDRGPPVEPYHVYSQKTKAELSKVKGISIALRHLSDTSSKKNTVNGALKGKFCDRFKNLIFEVIAKKNPKLPGITVKGEPLAFEPEVHEEKKSTDGCGSILNETGLELRLYNFAEALNLCGPAEPQSKVSVSRPLQASTTDNECRLLSRSEETHDVYRMRCLVWLKRSVVQPLCRSKRNLKACRTKPQGLGKQTWGKIKAKFRDAGCNYFQHQSVATLASVPDQQKTPEVSEIYDDSSRPNEESAQNFHTPVCLDEPEDFSKADDSMSDDRSSEIRNFAPENLFWSFANRVCGEVNIGIRKIEPLGHLLLSLSFRH